MDIIERLDAAIKTEDFWVGDQREDNILKDSKKIIEQLRKILSTVLEACEDVNSPDQKVRKEIIRTVGKVLKEKE